MLLDFFYCSLHNHLYRLVLFIILLIFLQHEKQIFNNFMEYTIILNKNL